MPVSKPGGLKGIENLLNVARLLKPPPADMEQLLELDVVTQAADEGVAAEGTKGPKVAAEGVVRCWFNTAAAARQANDTLKAYQEDLEREAGSSYFRTKLHITKAAQAARFVGRNRVKRTSGAVLCPQALPTPLPLPPRPCPVAPVRAALPAAAPPPPAPPAPPPPAPLAPPPPAPLPILANPRPAAPAPPTQAAPGEQHACSAERECLQRSSTQAPACCPFRLTYCLTLPPCHALLVQAAAAPRLPAPPAAPPPPPAPPTRGAAPRRRAAVVAVRGR